MTNEDAIEVLKNGYMMEIMSDEAQEAIDVGIKAIGEIDHLINRPCEACEFHKETGCSKWECVFTRGKGGKYI